MDRIHCEISEIDVVVEGSCSNGVFYIKHVWLEKSNDRVDIVNVLPASYMAALEEQCLETYDPENKEYEKEDS